MDDVEITDIDNGDFPRMETEPEPQNRDLSLLSMAVGDVLSQYGWYLLAVAAMVYLLIQYLYRRRSGALGNNPPPQTQQDALLVVKRQEAMEAARRKMQEELDAKAAMFKEKQKQQEDDKRRQKIEMWESMQQGKSYKGNTKLTQLELTTCVGEPGSSPSTPTFAYVNQSEQGLPVGFPLGFPSARSHDDVRVDLKLQTVVHDKVKKNRRRKSPSRS